MNILEKLIQIIRQIIFIDKEVRKSPKPALNENSKQENPESDSIRASIIKMSHSLKGVTYKYAGTNPREGFDCSGLVFYVFQQHDIILPRVSQQIAVQPGDIACFGEKDGKINHVGIITSHTPLTMIHSSSSHGVVETNIDSSDYWTKRFMGIKDTITDEVLS